MNGVKKSLQRSKHFVATRLVSPSFVLNGEKYSYLHHDYNSASTNERTVEVPIFQKLLKGYDPDKVLELGNVMRHYVGGTHDVVDKYETAPEVINEDIVDFQSPKRYGLIISVSTLEHVGWDETPRDAAKIPQAIDRLRHMLAANGKLIVSLPIGYNAYLDEILRTDTLDYQKRLCLLRITETNKWREATWEEIKDATYDDPYPAANAVVFLEFGSLD